MTMNIDWNGVKSLIKWEHKNSCVCCNVKFRKINNCRCEPCHFSPASSQRKSDINFFSTGFKPKAIFKKYGIPDKWGKSQLFYFMFYPELNNEYPNPRYIFDIFGNRINQDDINWVLHHDNNNNWDDHIYNLILCLRNEHTYFEQIDTIFYKNMFHLYKNI